MQIPIHECYRYFFLPMDLMGTDESVLVWCRENFGQSTFYDLSGRWTFHFGMFLFTNDNDATAFRLKFG